MAVPIPQLVQSFLKMMRQRKTSVVVLYGAVDGEGRAHVKMTSNVGAAMALSLVQQTARNSAPQLEDENITDATIVEPAAAVLGDDDVTPSRPGALESIAESVRDDDDPWDKAGPH